MKRNNDCIICTLYVFGTVKVTVAPVHAMQWGTVPLTLNFATRWRRMVSFMPWLLQPPQDPLVPTEGGTG
jgi:hypothetical protein